MIRKNIPFFLLLAVISGFWALIPAVSAQNSDKPFIKFVRAPSFDLPIDCRLNEDCWVLNYVDMGPDDDKKTDHKCLERTYDGHKGTDFAIADGLALEAGVNVLAAMDGTVERIRDSEPDRWATQRDLDISKNGRKECGNAILIDHSNGLQTIYCHLKQGSVKVKVGDNVKSGDVIGQVGLSGFTQFPHLHFGVIQEGALIDPFTGVDNTKSCKDFKRSLWKKELDVKYQPLIIQSIGFLDTVPHLHNLEQNLKQLHSIKNDTEIFSFWIIMLGSRKGDKIFMKIKDPDGKIFNYREIGQGSNRARQLYYTGRRYFVENLKPGTYTGSVVVIRNAGEENQQQWTKTKTILITP